MRRLAFALVLLVLGCAGAWAHSDEYFATHPTPHGGQIRMAGPYHLELVTGQDEMTIYVTDHGGNAVDTTGGSAKVIITSGKKKRYVVILSAGGDNVLHGSGEFKLGKSNTASVLIALPGQDPQRAQFTLSAAAAPKKSRKHH